MLLKRILHLLVVLQAVVSVELVAFGDDATPTELTRGFSQRKTEATELKYRTQWAVVVGINYLLADREGLEGAGTIPKLTNAENDARAVAEILKSHYGYLDDHVILLTGKQATRKAIVGKLRDELICSDQIREDDSVLFYFSGHGLTEDVGNGRRKCYLVPIDGESKANTATAVDIGYESQDVSRKCKARHKLFILDSCHSGSIFQLDGTSSSGNEYQQTSSGLFKERAFQAITSGLGSQEVSDGIDGHSPFTAALLQALKVIPTRLPKQSYVFSTNQLFSSVKIYLHDKLKKMKREQDPICRWLDGHQGEFHFLPDPKEKFEGNLLDEDTERKMLLAMVPSSFGNWWGDEAPWFMPSLRFQILSHGEKSRASQDEINLDQLKLAAMELRAREMSKGSEQSQRQIEYLDLLLKAGTQAKTNEAMESITTKLKESNEQSPRYPPDLHFLAVLQHKLDQIPAAEVSYNEAIKTYHEESETRPEYRPLEALCKADYGYFLLMAKKSNFDIAAKNFYDARRMFDTQSPYPFRLFTLIQEASAWRSNGNWGLANERMREACELLRNSDPKETHLLSAATWKQDGWNDMIQWRFREAISSFEHAQSILDKEIFASQSQAQIDRFHVKHGLAMVHRYLGDPDETLKRYRRLTPEIAESIRTLDNSRKVQENYAEIRALLLQRLVNSLERQGDCNLFSPQPDFAESADDYRRALRYCLALPDNQRADVYVQLLCKRAIAVSLKSESQDLDLARRLLDEIQKLPKKRQPGDHVWLLSQLATSIADYHCGADGISQRLSVSRAGKPPAEPNSNSSDLVENASTENSSAGAPPSRMSQSQVLSGLRNAIKQHSQKIGGQASRDDLESMMFGCRLLLEWQQHLLRAQQLEERFWIEENATMLQEFCGLAHRAGKPDPGTLKYLRPYYDAVFDAKRSLAPKHVKELIEVAWEATRGNDFDKPQTTEPLLTLFWTKGKCCLLLDVPGGPSKFYLVDDAKSPDDLRVASHSQDLLVLPDALRKELRDLAARQGQANQPISVVLRWHDPVYMLGFGKPELRAKIPNEVASSPAEAIPGLSESLAQLTLNPLVHFPFDVRPALGPKASREDNTGFSFIRTTAPHHESLSVNRPSN